MLLLQVFLRRDCVQLVRDLVEFPSRGSLQVINPPEAVGHSRHLPHSGGVVIAVVSQREGKVYALTSGNLFSIRKFMLLQ